MGFFKDSRTKTMIEGSERGQLEFSVDYFEYEADWCFIQRTSLNIPK